MSNQETKPVKKKTIEEIWSVLKKSYGLPNAPGTIAKETDKLLEKYTEALSNKKVNEEEKQELKEEVDKMLSKVVSVLTLENHAVASRTVSEFYESMVIEIANQLVKEYDVKTPSERALVGMIASSYGRYMEYARAFNNTQRLDYITNEKNAFYRNFAVEADRAFRQFQSGLAMLRQMKSPSMKVTVKAETAFVANNQQVNANTSKEANERIYDINEPK